MTSGLDRLSEWWGEAKTKPIVRFLLWVGGAGIVLVPLARCSLWERGVGEMIPSSLTPEELNYVALAALVVIAVVIYACLRVVLSKKEEHSRGKWWFCLVVGCLLCFFSASLSIVGMATYIEQRLIAPPAETETEVSTTEEISVPTYTPTEIVPGEATLTPTVSSAPSPTPLFGYDLSQASGNLDVAQFVAVYFHSINSARGLDDFEWSWQHSSETMQFVYEDNIETFASEWLQYRVIYDVYKCTETSVDVLLEYFGKGDINYYTEDHRIWRNYEPVIVGQNEWQLRHGSEENILRQREFCIIAQTNR